MKHDFQHRSQDERQSMAEALDEAFGFEGGLAHQRQRKASERQETLPVDHR